MCCFARDYLLVKMSEASKSRGEELALALKFEVYKRAAQRIKKWWGKKKSCLLLRF